MSFRSVRVLCASTFLLSVATVARSQSLAPIDTSSQQSRIERRHDSLLWVHAGVTAQLAGTFADWATSWKQPEGNSLLRESGGEYAGRFYRTGTGMKFGLAGGVTVVSYVIGWKFPNARKYVGIFNFAMGGGFAVQSFRNVANNPYYKP